MNLRWYWLRFVDGPMVTFHLQSNYQVRWNRIFGVQLGPWFVGAVRSRDVPLPPKVGTDDQ